VIADYLIASVSHRAAADQFIAFVLSSKGQAILVSAGFEGV
jgi:ABC-type molybdate transport system substrate-binding protein